MTGSSAKCLTLLLDPPNDFRSAVVNAVGEDGEPALEEQRLGEILGVLPREESQRVVDVILSRREDFSVFDTYISEYDRSMSLLEESCRSNSAFASIVKKFETLIALNTSLSSPPPTPHPTPTLLLQAKVQQYYLNNLSPDSKEYEDTQAALVIVSEVADQANDNLKQGENLLRLVHIEYSVKGKRDLLKPGRMFVKEGTLMKVSRKSRQPRHLFLDLFSRAPLPYRMFGVGHWMLASCVLGGD
ncbi:hypothetical protein INR49_012622 [Caranx melampygus]|nr:hypothetical protein INR49_012622 [Caranx melampygus]